MSVFKRWENYSNGHSLHMVKLVIYYLLHTWGVRKYPPLIDHYAFFEDVYIGLKFDKSAIFLEVAFFKGKKLYHNFK